MNYIHQLQRDLAAQIAANEEIRRSMRQFVSFLHSVKFTGDENGERRVWISTGDVLAWIRETESQSEIAGEKAFAEWQPPVNLEA